MEMGDGEMEEGDQETVQMEGEEVDGEVDGEEAGEAAQPYAPDGAVNPKNRPIMSIRPNLTRLSMPRICAMPRNWRVCGLISTSNYTRCRALFRALPTACNAACRPSRTGHGISIWKKVILTRRVVAGHHGPHTTAFL